MYHIKTGTTLGNGFNTVKMSQGNHLMTHVGISFTTNY